MDVIASVTSVTALVTVALKTTSVIYQTVRGIRDGPARVQSLEDQSRILHDGLTKIAGLIAHAESAGYGEDSTRFASLRQSMSQCVMSLQTVQMGLSKLRIDKDNGRFCRAWTFVQVLAREKEFARMAANLAAHTGALDLQLNSIGRDLDISNSQRLDQLGKDVSSSTQAITTRLDESELRCREINDTVTERLNGLEESHGTIERLLGKLASSSMSNGKFETLADLLEKITLQMQPQWTSLPQSSHQGETIDLGPNDVVDDGTSEAIDRLYQLASNKPQTISFREAQSIIDDLETILEVVEKKIFDCKNRGSLTTRKGNHAESAVEERNGDIKRVRRLLSASPPVLARSNKSILAPEDSEDFKSRGSSQHYIVSGGTVTVSCISKKSLTTGESRPSSELEDHHSNTTTESFSGTVTLLASKSSCRSKIHIAFIQKLTVAGFSKLSHSISFSSMIPDDSKVFEIATKGSTEELARLFADGLASSTDCDTQGRSLLNYSLHSLTLDISKFLIGLGTDVNSCESYLCLDVAAKSPLLQHCPGNDNEVYGEVLDLHIKRASLQLSEGADPMMDCQADWKEECAQNPFQDALSSGTKETVLNYLSKGSAFIDLDYRFQSSRTALLFLQSCVSCSGHEWIPDNTALLLDWGADVNALDSEGNGCLHTLIQENDFTELSQLSTVYRCLVLLINRGANMFLFNQYGLSVAALVHLRNPSDSVLPLKDVMEVALTKSTYKADLADVLALDHQKWHEWIIQSFVADNASVDLSMSNKENIPGSRNDVEIPVASSCRHKPCNRSNCNWWGWCYYRSRRDFSTSRKADAWWGSQKYDKDLNEWSHLPFCEEFQLSDDKIHAPKDTLLPITKTRAYKKIREPVIQGEGSGDPLNEDGDGPITAEEDSASSDEEGDSPATIKGKLLSSHGDESSSPHKTPALDPAVFFNPWAAEDSRDFDFSF